MALRRGFGQENARTDIFAAHREALNKAQCHQKHRCRNTDLRMSRQQADGKCAESHGQRRDDQHSPAAVTVADMAEDNGAQRTHRKAAGEGAEGGDQRSCRVVGREKQLADGDREKAIQGKVIPFEHIADETGRNP